MTGEIISVDDEQLAKMGKASDPVRRASLGELTGGSYMTGACDLLANQPSQAQVSVNVQALRLEYKLGWFDFFRSEPRVRHLALDRFTVEIAAHTATGDAPAWIGKSKSLLGIVPPQHFGGEINGITSGHRAPSACLAVCDDDNAPDSHRNGAPALDIWV